MTEAPALGAAGAVCFAFLVAGALVVIGRAGIRNGILAPLVLALLLRLVVTAVAHHASVGIGEGGLFYVDDRGYFEQGARIAHFWGHGEWVNPARADFTGSSQYGYWVLVAAIVLAIGKSLVAVKLVNVLCSLGTVLIVALICHDVLGSRAARTGAWVAALNPLLVWWAVPALKEAAVGFLVAAAVLCASRLGHSRYYAAGLVGAIVALAVTRATAALGIALAVAAAYAVAALRHRERVHWGALAKRAAIGGVAITIGLALLEQRTQFIGAYSQTFSSLVEISGAGSVTDLPSNAGLTFLGPFPWYFDRASQSWDRGLYPGVWVLYALYPVALLGVWRLRERPELVLIGGTTLVLVALGAASTGLAFRQRSSVEPLILVVAVAGMRSWRQALLLGCAAIAFVGVIAGLTLNSVPVALAIIAFAVFLATSSRLLPAGGLTEPLPPSPIEAAIAPPAAVEGPADSGIAPDEQPDYVPGRERTS